VLAPAVRIAIDTGVIEPGWPGGVIGKGRDLRVLPVLFRSVPQKRRSPPEGRLDISCEAEEVNCSFPRVMVKFGRSD
jgi:hypothetical protein